MTAKCKTCDGSGSKDTGGVREDGTAVLTCCPDCAGSGDDVRLTIFERVDLLVNQWVLNCGTQTIPPDCRHLLKKIMKQAVMDAAKCCEVRGNIRDYNMAIRNEAKKCAAMIRHNLLCKEGEHICYCCDGEGCERCIYTGIKRGVES